jgi:beta-phosphoglucomutase-like phosphatase (HAD superfamily)
MKTRDSIRALVFDLDETISGSPHVRAWRKALKQMGIKVPSHIWSQFIHRQRGVSNEQAALGLERLLGKHIDRQTLCTLKRGYAVQMAAKVPIYCDFMDALPVLLRRPYLVAIWTSSNRQYWETLCSRSALLSKVPCATIESDGGVSKPDPAGFFRALGLVGLSPSDAERTAVIGDSIAKDLKGGHNAGCKTLIYYCRSGRSVEADPDHLVTARVSRHRCLPSLLSRLAGE